MQRTRWWGELLLCVVAACGGDSGGGANGTGGGSTSVLTQTGGTSTSATTGGATGSYTSTGGATSSNSTTAAGSSSGGSGSGLVVPCGNPPGSNPDKGVICFYDVDNPDPEPAATIEHSVGKWKGQDALYIRLTLAPWFVDNTYGANTIGWPNDKHTFMDLVGSDHAEIHLDNPSGTTVFHFILDYISADSTSTSGYLDLGIWGGEGKMLEGDATQVLASTSSLSRNLNDRGYTMYTVDSPATDANYTPNPATPLWDYRVVYEVWIALDGFQMTDLPVQACIDYIHASPSKQSNNTKTVTPQECPPGWGCYNTDGCGSCDNIDPDLGNLCDPTDGGYPVP